MKKIDNPTSNVWYDIVAMNGTVLSENRANACYSGITYGVLPRTTKLIETWIDIKSTPFEENEIKQWIADLNEFGFPVLYKGVAQRSLRYDNAYKIDVHLFHIPIKEKRNPEQKRNYLLYKDRLHLNSGLILLRYLWENGIHKTLEKYLEFRSEFPNMDKFEAFQLAHLFNRNYVNFNHTVRDDNPQTFVTKRDMFKKMKGHSIFVDGNVSVSNEWSGKKVELEQDYRKQPVERVHEEIKNRS